MTVALYTETGALPLAETRQLSYNIAFDVSVGLKVPVWKISFSSVILRLSVVSRWRDRQQTGECCLGRLKCVRD